MILVPILLYIPCPQGPFDDLAHKIFQPRHYNCRYQARKMSGHLFMLWGIDSASDFPLDFETFPTVRYFFVFHLIVLF